MGISRSIVLTAILGAGAMMLGSGCTVEAEPPHVEPAHIEVAPVGYVYGPEYYDHGYYRDGFWYWHDHDGRYYREAREEHERRDREWRGRGGHEEREHHDQH